MNMKRLSAAALTLAVAALPVLATGQSDQPQEIAVATVSKLLLNGQQLDTSAIPVVGEGLVPMRLLCEADHGSASWYPEEGQSYFYLDTHGIQVDFADNSVTADGEKLEGITATVTDGVTFLPLEVLTGLEGISVTPDENAMVISTPNGMPLTALAWQIIDEIPMASTMKNSPEDLSTYYDIDPANYEEVIGFSSFNIRADTIIIGKYAEGADKEAAKEQLSARRAAEEQSFEHYLPEPYAMAQAGQVVESADGAYVMLIISENNGRAIELFEASVDTSAAE